MNRKKIKFSSELRQDLVSKDWVVIATGRSKRPGAFKREEYKKEKVSSLDCPFCKITEDQKTPTLILNKGKEISFDHLKENPYDWTITVIPNKYPAFDYYEGIKLEEKEEGNIYQKMNAVGFHEVVVTKDHEKQIAQFSLKQVKELFDVYQRRYLDLMEKKFTNHISIFHNHGKKAGASIYHPHSQIITTPLVDVDVERALSNSQKYSKDEKECVYCRMNQWEMKENKRIVFENDLFMAVCPFASKTAFQVIISPKKHLSYFERITEKEKLSLSEVFRSVMNKLYKGLGNPDYNFYLHTSPCDGEKHDYYHWHWTILPKTSIWAGFELGTEMEISTIEPEKAAKYLREIK